MTLFHYFSKDANKRAKFIFNLIAPIYARVDKSLINNYKDVISQLNSEINLSGKKVLDIGAGTGAWSAAYLSGDVQSVNGVDFSEKMVNVSQNKHPEISFSVGNAENLHDINDNKFDIVTAAYVLHGVKNDRREKILLEMKRISKQYVVIHDFSGRTPIFVRFLEFMEQSDYKNFKKNFCDELKQMFKNVRKFETNYGSGIYIAEV